MDLSSQVSVYQIQTSCLCQLLADNSQSDRATVRFKLVVCVSCLRWKGEQRRVLRVLRVVARLLARPTGLEGWKSLGHEKIAAGPQQPRSLVLRGERAGYVNNPPRLQLDFHIIVEMVKACS